MWPHAAHPRRLGCCCLRRRAPATARRRGSNRKRSRWFPLLWLDRRLAEKSSAQITDPKSKQCRGKRPACFSRGSNLRAQSPATTPRPVATRGRADRPIRPTKQADCAHETFFPLAQICDRAARRAHTIAAARRDKIQYPSGNSPCPQKSAASIRRIARYAHFPTSAVEGVKLRESRRGIFPWPAFLWRFRRAA